MDERNIVCTALKGLVERFPEIIKIADVALDPYTDHGHDGLLINGSINNDRTLDLLQNQALLLAQSIRSIGFRPSIIDANAENLSEDEGE